MLAGILFEIGIEIFVAAQHRTALVLRMFFTYLIVKRFSPRYAMVTTLMVGTVAAGGLGMLDFSRFHVALAHPVLTMPSFSLAATISIGIPLFVVAMASQNVPGIAVLRADDYHALVAADHDHRPRFAAARAVRLARHHPCRDQRSDLHRPARP